MLCGQLCRMQVKDGQFMINLGYLSYPLIVLPVKDDEHDGNEAPAHFLYYKVHVAGFPIFVGLFAEHLLYFVITFFL